MSKKNDKVESKAPSMEPKLNDLSEANHSEINEEKHFSQPPVNAVVTNGKVMNGLAFFFGQMLNMNSIVNSKEAENLRTEAGLDNEEVNAAGGAKAAAIEAELLNTNNELFSESKITQDSYDKQVGSKTANGIRNIFAPTLFGFIGNVMGHETSTPQELQKAKDIVKENEDLQDKIFHTVVNYQKETCVTQRQDSNNNNETSTSPKR